jgi:hypothetical protein
MLRYSLPPIDKTPILLTVNLYNPFWSAHDCLHDPSVLLLSVGYLIYYTRYTGKDGHLPKSWAVDSAFTPDFRSFEERGNLTPIGHASPGDLIFWHGHYILPYQTNSARPTRHCFSESANLRLWSALKLFLEAAADLPWNDLNRDIDPTFVVENDTLHCWFVGSCRIQMDGKATHANLLGHANTQDPELAEWIITLVDSPLLGISPEAPDGVENVSVIRTGDQWTMIYSESLKNQRLARAVSPDLLLYCAGKGRGRFPSRRSPCFPESMAHVYLARFRLRQSLVDDPDGRGQYRTHFLRPPAFRPARCQRLDIAPRTGVMPR